MNENGNHNNLLPRISAVSLLFPVCLPASHDVLLLIPAITNEHIFRKKGEEMKNRELIYSQIDFLLKRGVEIGENKANIARENEPSRCQKL